MRIIKPLLYFAIFAQLSFPAASSADITVGTTSQVSISSAGGAPDSQSSDPAIGANGGHLAFLSRASDLVAGDNNGFNDAFVKDLKTGILTLASVATGGAVADADSYKVAVSPVLLDGFFAIAIESGAKNLGTLDNPPGSTNIFIRLPGLDITEIVSPDPNAPVFGNQGSSQPSVTVVQNNDGSKEVRVVFASSSDTLVSNDTNNTSDIFLARFRVPTSQTYVRSELLTVQRISLAAAKSDQANGPSGAPKISADGRYVVFSSSATNLVTGLSPDLSATQIYRYDIETNTTLHVSKSAGGQPADNDCYDPSLSYNGRSALYKTLATNVVTSINPEFYNLVWNDLVTGAIKRVNETASGEAGNSSAGDGMVSANGRIVVFADSSSNLVSGDLNNVDDIFAKDMEGGAIVRVSVAPGQSDANQFSSTPVVAGPYNSLVMTVGFASYATNLTNPSTSSNLSEIYQNSIALDPPVLSAETPLDVPPEVVVKAKKLTFKAQKFAASPVSASGRKIQYEFEITATNRVNGKKRTTRTLLISKRNTVTTIKQKATTYVVRNRIRAVKASTGATQFKTVFTPRLRFTT